MPVIDAGQRLFGENRVQEAKAKWPPLKERHPDLALHLIGTLQSNKAKEAIALFDAIHSVDRPNLCAALAKEIDKQRRRPILFVEVNTGGEPQKSGVLPEDTDAFLRAYRRNLWVADRGPYVHPATYRSAGPAFRLDGQDRAPEWTRVSVDGHERRFPHRDPFRRDPCPGRQRHIRRARPYAITIRVRTPSRRNSARKRDAGSATHPAVGRKPGRATCTNTALPRPVIRGRVLWSSSMMKS